MIMMVTRVKSHHIIDIVNAMMKILVLTDISILGFYGYIRDISIFINYSKFKDIFNLYIKISLKVY